MSLIKRLREFECALRAERVQAVRVPLQFRQVIQQRRRHALGLRFDLFDLRLTRADTFADGFRLFAVRRQASPPHPSARRPGGTMCLRTSRRLARRERRHDVPVVFGNEVPDGKLAFDDHRERRSLHAADRELFTAAERVCSRQIHADEPVGTAAPPGRVGERIVLARVFQPREASRMASGVSDEIQSRCTGLSQPAAS